MNARPVGLRPGVFFYALVGGVSEEAICEERAARLSADIVDAVCVQVGSYGIGVLSFRVPNDLAFGCEALDLDLQEGDALCVPVFIVMRIGLRTFLSPFLHSLVRGRVCVGIEPTSEVPARANRTTPA